MSKVKEKINPFASTNPSRKTKKFLHPLGLRSSPTVLEKSYLTGTGLREQCACGNLLEASGKTTGK
jgi:hypothetical protein